MNSNDITVLNGIEPPNGGDPAPSVSTPWGRFNTPGIVPGGYTDFQSLAASAISAASGESGKKQQLLTQAAGIAASAAGIPVAGWVVAFGSLIMGTILSALGIRGRTQHVGIPECTTSANQFISTQVSAYNAIPLDAKAQFLRLVMRWRNMMGDMMQHNWDDAAIHAGYGRFPDDWADQFLQTDPSTWWQKISYQINFWFVIVMHNLDAEHLQDEGGPGSFQADFMNWYNSEVLLPLDRYMVEKYNATIADYEAIGGSAPVETGGSSNTGYLVAAGVGLLALVGNAKS